MSATEICIAGVIRSLYFHNKFIDVENDSVLIYLLIGSTPQRAHQHWEFITFRQGYESVSSTGKELSHIV